MHSYLLPTLLVLAPLMGKSQSLDNIVAPVFGLANDSLTKKLLSERPIIQPVPLIQVEQTMVAAAEFASKPLPFKVSSTQQLATYLTQPFKSEKLKAWVLYIWMAKNLKYDTNYYSSKKFNLVRYNPLEVLLYRKSICQGYANLYTELAHKANLKSVVVDGLFKGTVPGSEAKEHAWNLVKVEGKWENVDVLCYDPLYPTYDFMLEPNLFQLTHFAKLKQMRLASHIITIEEFKVPIKKGDSL